MSLGWRLLLLGLATTRLAAAPRPTPADCEALLARVGLAAQVVGQLRPLELGWPGLATVTALAGEAQRKGGRCEFIVTADGQTLLGFTSARAVYHRAAVYPLEALDAAAVWCRQLGLEAEPGGWVRVCEPDAQHELWRVERGWRPAANVLTEWGVVFEFDRAGLRSFRRDPRPPVPLPLPEPAISQAAATARALAWLQAQTHGLAVPLLPLHAGTTERLLSVRVDPATHAATVERCWRVTCGAWAKWYPLEPPCPLAGAVWELDVDETSGAVSLRRLDPARAICDGTALVWLSGLVGGR